MLKQSIKLPNPINKTDFRTLPSSNGVYIFKHNEDYMYIGKSNNIKVRILSHFENAKIIPKEKAIFDNSNTLEYVAVDSEFNALILEASLIQKHHPKYNVIWKDGRSYLYIKITIKDDYPKLFSVRKERDKNSLYYGPFGSSKDVNILMRSLRKIFPFCTQKKVTAKACFYNKIGLCNPCPNTVSTLQDPVLKNQQKAQYRNNIKSIIKILNGNTDLILKARYRELKLLSESQHYEQAIKVRNSISNLEFLIHNRSFSQEINQNHNFNATASLFTLLKQYFSRLKKPSRIECYDISNLSQKQSTASMVVAINGMMDKSQYRKFKIKRVSSRSDFDMLKEVVDRRLKHTWPLPNLIILDGGRPQVKMIKDHMISLQKDIPVIGIAKNPDRLIIGDSSLSTFRPAIYNDGFNLIRMMRDESHRFAKKYHLYLRERKIV